MGAGIRIRFQGHFLELGRCGQRPAQETVIGSPCDLALVACLNHPLPGSRQGDLGGEQVRSLGNSFLEEVAHIALVCLKTCDDCAGQKEEFLGAEYVQIRLGHIEFQVHHCCQLLGTSGSSLSCPGINAGQDTTARVDGHVHQGGGQEELTIQERKGDVQAEQRSLGVEERS